MFTCENCHREKPDNHRVQVNPWVRFVIGLMVPLQGSVVCHRCSGRVKRLGLVALVGMLIIGIFTLLVLNFLIYTV